MSPARGLASAASHVTGRPRPRVAVVGSGISGLAAAYRLNAHAEVTLFEAGHHFGGHANTVDLTLEGVTHGVDTGFLVFNQATYPNLIALFDTLQVPTAPSDMSFSVQVPQRRLEWSGTDLDSVFAQRRNLLRPRFWRMLVDLLRFNRATTEIAEREEEAGLQISLGEFLDQGGYSQAFRDWYLLPMLGCIWSCPTDQMLRFPVATMIRFCHNHGLIRVTDRPQWHTVAGGSREYVRRMLAHIDDARLATPVRAVRRVPPGTASAGVWLDLDSGSERFDEVVLATHSDQSLALLGEHASPQERGVLGAIRYHRNRVLLHTDAGVLPGRRKAWAAWNYERAPADSAELAAVCLHYLINRLQPLPWQTPVIVSMNPAREPDPRQVHAEFDYAHPVFDLAAIAAQREVPALQGEGHVWFAGAWTRYGFHEDGLRAGLAVADRLLQRWQMAGTAPWPIGRAAA